MIDSRVQKIVELLGSNQTGERAAAAAAIYRAATTEKQTVNELLERIYGVDFPQVEAMAAELAREKIEEIRREALHEVELIRKAYRANGAQDAAQPPAP